MSYAAVETSDYSAAPVEFYRFTLGTQKWLYTSAAAPVVYASETYEPYPLRRGNIVQTPALEKSGLEIRTVRDLPFVLARMANPLQGRVLLTVYRQHLSDAEVKTLWRGRVEGLRFEDAVPVLSCVPLGASLARIGLRRPAQRQCPHALFDVGCKVSAAAFSISGTLVSHTGATVTAGAFASQPNGWWTGGKITLDGDPRIVLAHTTDTLTLGTPVPGLPQNAGFVLTPGCDHSASICNSKFANILNYGGAPAFPVKNPFTGDAPA